MLATSRNAMERVVDQILEPGRFRVAIRDLVAVVTEQQAARAGGTVAAAVEVPYDTAWMPRFCELLTETGKVLSACTRLRAENPGSPARSTIYVRRRQCSRFAREWAEALRVRRTGGASA